MRYGMISMLAAGLMATAAFFSFSGRAEAYSINGTSTTAGSTDSYNLTTPFENFFNSLEYNITSAGNETPVNLNPAQEPLTHEFETGAHGVLEQFDAWLYGVAGFHILNFFTAILSIFSTILGWLKSGTDWLLRLV